MPNTTGSGKLKLGGCAVPTVQQFYYSPYSQGGTAYIKAKASNGRIEKISIKKVLLHRLENTSSTPFFTYLDMMNEVWMERELCSHAVALQLAEQYWQEQIAKVTQLINSCP